MKAFHAALLAAVLVAAAVDVVSGTLLLSEIRFAALMLPPPALKERQTGKRQNSSASALNLHVRARICEVREFEVSPCAKLLGVSYTEQARSLCEADGQRQQVA